MNPCPENPQFQFTRHALSCNNINAGNYIYNGKDFEPSITQYGIIYTIYFTKENKEHFTSSHVYVSNLLRTWITAFLLYGPHEPDNLHLYISPYLKEKHMSIIGIDIERGNFPKEFLHTIEKFIKTMNLIRKQSTETFPEKVTLHLPPFKGESQKVVFTYDNEYNHDDELCSIHDTRGIDKTSKLKEEQFLKTGNLQKFMNWFNSEDNYYGRKCSNDIIHVVTHSQIMQSYLKSKFGMNIKENIKKIN